MTKYDLTDDEAVLVADILADIAAGVAVLRYHSEAYDPWAKPTKEGRALMNSVLKKLPADTCGDGFVAFMESTAFRPKIKHPWGGKFKHEAKEKP